MNKNIKDEREVNAIQIFGMILPSMPSLIFRFAGDLLRFKSKANKAGKVFNKELVKQGIEPEIAKELTDIYMESSHIRKYIKSMS